MKTQLHIKCKSYDFEALFKKKGYAYFTNGNYNLNIIGVRSNQNNKVTNKFDDCLVVIYNTNNGLKRQVYTITTEPGLKFMKAPINCKGTAILAPGQYRGAYKIDKHRGKYDALCQRNKPVKVYRDNNRDMVYDYNPGSTDIGMFGINALFQIVEQQERAGAAVAAGVVVVELETQMLAERVQLVVQQIRIRFPAHLAGT